MPEFRIILVEPEYEINLGACARLMKNFDFPELWLVNPKADVKGKEAVKFAKHSKEVLENAKIAKEKNVHVEITNLIISTLNDSDKNIAELVDWIYANLGDDTPLHFSRYFPCHKMKLPPTPAEALERAKRIADKKLKYVYLGSV